MVIAVILWLCVLNHSLPPGILKDIRAGMQAAHIKDPDQRIRTYMEARYGAMSDPAHRQDAFLDFFNIEHIQAIQMMVKHSPEEHRQENIDAMSRWVAEYRASLTSQDRIALKALLQTAEGQTMLKSATALYNSQDVRYRGSTAPVISQLLRTIHDVEQIR